MIKNPVKLVGNYIFGRRHPESIALSEKDRVLKYADDHIDTMFKIHKSLMENKKPAEFSEKMWKQFNKLKIKFAKDPDYADTYIRDAAEQVIKKFQKAKLQMQKC